MHLPSQPLALTLTLTLTLALTMAFWGGTYTRQVNERGDTFYTYNGSPAGTRSEDNSDDDNNHGEGDGDIDEDLADQFADFNLGDAGDEGHGDRTRHHGVHGSNTTRVSSTSQWDLDNRPIPGAYPTYEDSTSQGTASSQLSHGLITLEDAVRALELPILHAPEGHVHFLVVQAAVQFIFNNLPFLDDFRADMPELGDLYEERAVELATQFFADYGVALWGHSAGGDEVKRERLARLEILFFVLREHYAIRSEVEGDEVETLRKLVNLRRGGAHDAIPYHTGHDKTVKPKKPVNVSKTTVAAQGLRFDPNARLPELYFALEIQNPDSWINGAFPRAVAQMAFDALYRVRDDVDRFPCARPSDATVERIVQRIMVRYSRKLWPNSFTQPDEARKILHYYILALLKTNMARTEVSEKDLRILDGILGLDDGDAEEEKNREPDPPKDVGIYCTLKRDDVGAIDESCHTFFASRKDLSLHLVEIHEFDEVVADDIVTEYF